LRERGENLQMPPPIDDTEVESDQKTKKSCLLEGGRSDQRNVEKANALNVGTNHSNPALRKREHGSKSVTEDS